MCRLSQLGYSGTGTDYAITYALMSHSYCWTRICWL